jgi:hypothetical protein
MADNIVIKVDLDTGNTTQTFNRIESGAKKSGQKAGSNFSNEFSKSLGGLAKTAAKLSSIIGGIAGAFTFAKSIKAAQVQEDAVNRLNSALAQTGKFSAETSKELQDFAASLQDVTKFGDEAIISAQGLIQSLGNLSKNQLKDATKATVDLASALRIDLDTAARLVGKAAAGNTDAFSRYGIQIQKTGDQARDFANVLGLIEQKFGGRAQQEALTFSGLIARISNNFGDLLESFGAFITQNPFVIKALSERNTILKQSAQSVGGLYAFQPMNAQNIRISNLSIDGQTTQQTCELDESIHREILDRAVQLALRDYKPEKLESKIQLDTRNE